MACRAPCCCCCCRPHRPEATQDSYTVPRMAVACSGCLAAPRHHHQQRQQQQQQRQQECGAQTGCCRLGVSAGGGAGRRGSLCPKAPGRGQGVLECMRFTMVRPTVGCMQLVRWLLEHSTPAAEMAGDTAEMAGDGGGGACSSQGSGRSPLLSLRTTHSGYAAMSSLH